MKKINGFTLIEVLVALVILAIAFTALLETTRSTVHGSSIVKKSIVSSWVASNIFSELTLGLVSAPDTGSDISGTENMLGNDWNWSITTEETDPTSGLKRVAIDVSQDNRRYQHLIGFI